MKKEDTIRIFIDSKNLFSNSTKALVLADEKMIGERDSGLTNYSVYEAFYLIEGYKARLIKNDKEIDIKGSMKAFKRIDKDFPKNYICYRSLRKKGFVPKSGLKFGAEFRVYDNPKTSLSKHARYLTFIIRSDQKIDWKEYASRVRIAHSTAKKLLIAIIDPENKATFFESDWIKF